MSVPSRQYPERWGLTERERQVLDWLLLGYSQKRAGKALGISPRTVESHRAHIMAKLDVQSTIELGYTVGFHDADGERKRGGRP